MKNTTASISAITVAALTGTVQAETNNTVLDKITDNPDHTLFVEAAAAVGLDEILRLDSGFTLFLPTDDALEEAALDIDLSEPLSPDEIERLQELLRYHIVPDELPSAAIASQHSLETAAGEHVHVATNGGKTTVNSAAVLEPDLMADNGVVHVIDSLLEPPGTVS